MGCPGLAIHPTDAQALSVHGAPLASPSLIWQQGKLRPREGSDSPRHTQRRLEVLSPTPSPTLPWAGWLCGYLRGAGCRELGWGWVRSSLSQQTPPHLEHPPPMTCVPAPLLGVSASPQEGQEDGPAGWRARLKPVEKKNPAER